MAQKRRSKVTKSKKTAGRKAKPAKPTPKKRAAARKPAAKMASVAKSKRARARKQPPKKRTFRRGKQEQLAAVPLKALDSRSGLQSGDLQGLREVESVDSESVGELVEEGNAFEAGIVAGVEEAGDHAEEEVHTHEVTEDDVPEEYLDQE